MTDGGFAFAFGGEDIHESAEDTSHAHDLRYQEEGNRLEIDDQPSGRQTRSHDLQEILESLPSHITYSSLDLTDEHGYAFSVPKRDYADVRVQMMAEDEGEYSAYLTGSDDIKENEYEGGFKTWECAVDLANMVVQMCSSSSSGAEYGTIIELGCGSAIPSLVMFQNALTHQNPTIFNLADYNEEVLRLLTVPNLLLNWAKTSRNPTEPSLINPQTSSPSPITQKEANRTNMNTTYHNNTSLLSSSSGHFDITPQIVASFLSDLARLNIKINLVSGSWHPAEKFTSLLSVHPSSLQAPVTPANTQSQSEPRKSNINTLILSAETVYSPKSLIPFVSVLEGVLRQQQQQQQQQKERHEEKDSSHTSHHSATSSVKISKDMNMQDVHDDISNNNGNVNDDANATGAEAAGQNKITSNASKALVAAKRIYFGVGGGIDAFIEAAKRKKMVVDECSSAVGEIAIGRQNRCKVGNGDGSVSRCIVEVKNFR